MMPYDENENRFEAARKAFQWMERSKPSVSARGEVALPEERGDGTPDGRTRRAAQTAKASRHGARSTKPEPPKSRRFFAVCGFFSFSAAFSCK